VSEADQRNEEERRRDRQMIELRVALPGVQISSRSC
jgi:hypothetical protein